MATSQFIIRARVEGLRDFGPAIKPVQLLPAVTGPGNPVSSCTTSCRQCTGTGPWLEHHEQVESVNYPGLESSPYHANSQKIPAKRIWRQCCPLSSVEPKNTATALVDSLKLVSHLANVGDAKTLIIHPAATTHQQLSDEEQMSAGVTPNQLRVSVGIEHIDDIKADFEQAFEKVRTSETVEV